MKLRLWVFFLLALVAINPAPAQEKSHEPTSVKIAIGDWPPYMAENLNGNGVAAKLITEAFAAVGIKVEYAFYPWNRSLELVRRGGIEATGVWFESDDRRADFYISDPVIDSNYRLYHHKDKPINWGDFKDLRGLKIGATAGYFYGEAFERAEKNGEITVIRASSDQINLKNLVKGRLDGFPLDQIVASYMIANEFSAADGALIGHSQMSVHSRPLNLLTSRKAANGEALIRLFNRGLNTIRKNGTYEQIMKDPTFGQKKE